MTFPIPPTGIGSVIATRTLSIRRGDRLPSIVVQIIDEFGTPVDITGYQAWISFRRLETSDGAGPWGLGIQTIISDETQGIISYDWQLEDTLGALPGTYEFVVSMVDPITKIVEFTAPTTRDTFVAIRSSILPIGYSDVYLTDKNDAFAVNVDGAYALGNPDGY